MSSEHWAPTLAEELAERAKRQMIDTEREAFQAAQSGDKSRQSIASTESERHRAVYHAICLILDDQRKSEPAIPRTYKAGRYLAEVNDGRLLYLNHANSWQECPNFISDMAVRIEALEAENARLLKALRSVETQADNAAWNIGRPGHNFTPADIQAGYFNIRDFARRAREGGNNA